MLYEMMKYFDIYIFLLNAIATGAGIALSLYSISHYLLVQKTRLVYRIHHQWYILSGVLTAITIFVGVVTWVFSIISSCLGYKASRRIERIRLVSDAFVIALCLLWIPQLFIEMTVPNYSIEYRNLISDSLSLYVLLLSARIPLMFQMQQLPKKSGLRVSDLAKRDSISFPSSNVTSRAC